MRRVATALLLSAALAAPAATAAAPRVPPAGELAARSLGGIEIGWTRAQVEAAWGRAYGRCRSCARETLYYNRFAFQPEGAAVELVRGRVSAVLTVWGPRAWRTTRGTRIGDPLASLTGRHRTLPPVACPDGTRGYVLAERRAAARGVVYTVDDTVWALALLGPGSPVCR